MTVSKSARLGLTRWSAPTDPWSRADFDADNAALEANAAMYAHGNLADRPAAGKAGRLYKDENSGIYYDTGATWLTVRHPIADVDLNSTLPAGVTANGIGLRFYRDASGMAAISIGLNLANARASNTSILTVPALWRPPSNHTLHIAIRYSGAQSGMGQASISPSSGFLTTDVATVANTSISGFASYPTAPA